MKINVIVENSTEDSKIDIKFYKNISKKIFREVFKLVQNNKNLAEYRHNNFSFDILFVDNSAIQEINSKYRNKNTPTDVITFALFFDSDDKTIDDTHIELGEIIISVDTAYKQAQENNISQEEEIETLIAHGILHLLGFDHLTDSDYTFVVDVQKKVIGKLA